MNPATDRKALGRLRRRIASAVLALIVAVAAAGVPAAAGGALSVRVFERVEIEEDQVLLGKIARIDGEDANAVKSLAAIVIGRAPLPGKSRAFDPEQIALRLRQNGVDPGSIDLQAPAEVLVVREAVEIGRERVEQIVKAFLERQVETRAESLRVKEIRSFTPLLLPPGKIDCEVLAPKNTVFSGVVPLTLQFKVNGNLDRRIGVTAVLEALAPAVFSKRPMGRLKPVEAGDVEVRTAELSELPSDFISDPQEVIGKRLRRAVDSRTVLRSELLESPPTVKRGDRVVIVAEAGGLRITAVGQVRQNGYLGERVPVVNLDSNRTVAAQVVDAQTVRIDF
jgi:flagella basal body P-ring formation protein FlgA